MEDKAAFLMARYKYILSQKQTLNKATLKIAVTYQAGIGLIGSGQFTVMALLGEGKVTQQLAWVGSLILLILVCVLSTFSVLLLGGGIGSWLGYRADEAKIEREVFGVSRESPTVLNIVWWYETYIVLAIIVVLLSYVFGFWHGVLPYLSGSQGVR